MSESLFAELAKPHRRVYYNKKWIRLEHAAIETLRPEDIYMLALYRKTSFPLGVLLAHIDCRECVLFPAGERPVLMDLETGLQLLKGRLTLGLALLGRSVYIIQFGKYKAAYKNALAAV